MSAAVIATIAGAFVSVASVVFNAIITSRSIRAESQRAREDREANAKQRREDQQAERVARRDELVRTDLASRIAARWAAARAVIESEQQAEQGDVTYAYMAAHAVLVQSMIMLTHPDEANLRTALQGRAALLRWADGTPGKPLAWWHPWVTEWARNPDTPMLYGQTDTGKVF